MVEDGDGLRIRPAVEADVAAIAGMIRALAEFEDLGAQVVVTDELLRTHLFGARPYAEVLIADDGAGPVGMALFFHTFSTFLGRPGLYLEDLFVYPQHRSRGIGRRLFESLARICVERGCGRIEWAVLDWNERAIGFYTTMGALPNAGWTVYRLAGDGLTRLAPGL